MSKRIQNIVLLGLGHTHAHVVKEWAKHPIPGCQLTAITDHLQATYSGMLPGVLAGDYQNWEMQIDLVRLCKAANVRLIDDQASHLDRAGQVLTFRSGRQLPYSLLSVAVGSRPPQVPGVKDSAEGGTWFVPIKPMQTLLERIDRSVADAIQHCKKEGRPQVQVDVVGGGLGSLEIAMCLPNWMKQNGLRDNDFNLRIISGSDNPPEGCLQSTRKKIQSILKKRNVTLLTDAYLERVGDRQLILRNGVSLPSDMVIYVGAGIASRVTEVLDVQLDDRRCVLTDAQLCSVDDPRIWAAGDCGSIQGKDVPKAGVYAVRQGPVIWNNLKNWAAGQPLEAFRPQQDFLKLINTGDGSAIGQWKGFSVAGTWVWRWKDRIDRKFLKMYQDLAQGEMKHAAGNAMDQASMRCLGCGGKIGGQMLRQTLATIVNMQTDDTVMGSDEDFQVLNPERLNDDVAIWSQGGLPGTSEARSGEIYTAVSVDTMADPIADPFLFGKIAVLHSLSDLWASGIRPQRITLSVELPFDRTSPQDILLEVMTGVIETLRDHRVELVGGHTLEGQRLSLSIAAFGASETAAIPLPKQGLQVGDVLIYTKPLGIGIALAAGMRNQCSAETRREALSQMQLSNEVALLLADKFPVHAATDVTGFGLAGHLHEMVADSQVSIDLDPEAIVENLLPGVERMIAAGIESTIASSNREYLPLELLAVEPIAAAMVDPQTSGGLLFAIPQAAVADCLSLLNEEDLPRSWVVGTVVEASQTGPWLQLSQTVWSPAVGSKTVTGKTVTGKPVTGKTVTGKTVTGKTELADQPLRYSAEADSNEWDEKLDLP